MSYQSQTRDRGAWSVLVASAATPAPSGTPAPPTHREELGHETL